MGLLSYQPLTAIYAGLALVYELARLPVWLKYITSYGRQHPKWTFRQAISVRLFSSALYHIANVQIKTPLLLTPGKEKERFIVIKPASADYYKGPLTPNEHVKPVDIGASWYPAPLTPTSNTSALTVVLHIHGGAYVLGDGRTADSGYFTSKLLKHAGATHVFAPQYRISTLPASSTSNPFPAALQDSLTAYLYLTKTLGISPANVVLSGDSAGANAAIAILRYISEYGADLDIAAPKAAWLWSPWVNPNESLKNTLTSNPHYGTDYLAVPFTVWGGLAYAGLAGPSILDSPYVSAGDRPFKTQVPIWVNTGGAEVLFFEDKAWAEMMSAAGNNVVLDVEENVPHDVLLTGARLGFDKEATSCAKRAGEWLKEVRSR